MTTPRKVLIDPVVPLFYHLVSRCVRRSFLCGYDRLTRKNYNYRKQWLIDRLYHLAQFFAIEVHAYTIMSNHFHLVVYYDPIACQRWSDEEVADRWLAVSPPKLADGGVDLLALLEAKRVLLPDTDRLEHARHQLGSISTFMKLLKQPIARRANLEDGCTGHFFEQRFYSGALLDDDSILAAMAYVDINPIRAEIARTIEACRDSSVAARLEAAAHTPEALQDLLAPLVSGLKERGRIVRVRLAVYLNLLKTIFTSPDNRTPDEVADRWRSHVATIRKRQRAYGARVLLDQWISTRGLQRREVPMVA